MKKALLLIAAILLIAVICIYFFIPSNIEIADVAAAKTTKDGAYRMIASKTAWKKWWNYNTSTKNTANNDTIFPKGVYIFNLTGHDFNGALVSIQHKNKTISSKISLLQLPMDSVGIMWQCSLQTSANPVEKIKQYFEAVSIKKNMKDALNCFKAFVEKDENIYGMKILESSIKDSFLISEKREFAQQPTMNEVYTLINDLKQYAAQNNCMQTNPPMLNILTDSDKYRVMVALPVNKPILTKPPVSLIKMVKGNFMIAQVHGGLRSVQNALQQMQLYFSDYNKTSMAIPFQYLVTDRLKEADTTKWITEIYAPVL